MKNSKKVTATPVVEIPSYETIIGILAPTVENNDPFEMELFQEIEQKTGFAYENLEQDSKKLIFEFRNAGQILFITFKFKGAKLVATWKFEEMAAPAATNKGLVFTPLEEVQAGLAAEIEAEFGLTENEKVFIETNFVVDGEVAIFHAHKLQKSNSKMAKSIAAKLHTFVDNASGVMVPTSWLPGIYAAPAENSLPSIEELEERINDLPTKKGRGYANAGKKYDHSGVRVEEFKLGKAKVKKGDKLFFKIGKVEVCGVFSHLNKCVHCPEGYAVIRFEGKNMERRQSRVSLTATAE